MPERTDQPAGQPTPRTEPTLRLAPALLRGQKIHIEEPSWCTADHVAASVGYLDDLDHTGTPAYLAIPGGEQPLVSVSLSASPYAPTAEDRATTVVVDDGSGGTRLTPEEARELARRLTAFAGELLALAAVAEVAA